MGGGRWGCCGGGGGRSTGCEDRYQQGGLEWWEGEGWRVVRVFSFRNGRWVIRSYSSGTGGGEREGFRATDPTVSPHGPHSRQPPPLRGVPSAIMEAIIASWPRFILEFFFSLFNLFLKTHPNSKL